MKRELKQHKQLNEAFTTKAIAEPIPMKRELKLHPSLSWASRVSDCRAYPDEKGIETAR